jgi:hypothetical protein
MLKNVFLIYFFKCYKLHLKIILINNFFEIIFLKTFLCRKKNSKCPKNPKKSFSSCVIGTPVNYSRVDSQRACGHF